MMSTFIGIKILDDEENENDVNKSNKEESDEEENTYLVARRRDGKCVMDISCEDTDQRARQNNKQSGDSDDQNVTFCCFSF